MRKAVPAVEKKGWAVKRQLNERLVLLRQGGGRQAVLTAGTDRYALGSGGWTKMCRGSGGWQAVTAGATERYVVRANFLSKRAHSTMPSMLAMPSAVDQRENWASFLAFVQVAHFASLSASMHGRSFFSRLGRQPRTTHKETVLLFAAPHEKKKVIGVPLDALPSHLSRNRAST